VFSLRVHVVGVCRFKSGTWIFYILSFLATGKVKWSSFFI